MHETSSKITTITSGIIILGAIILFIVLITGNPKMDQEQVLTTPETMESTENSIVNPETFTAELNQNDTVTAGQTITGSVPGFWFFEGSFPVDLVDGDGNVFVTVLATSPEDWMTPEIIPFTITLPETLAYTGTGKIVFTRNDPSDGESSIPASETTATILVNFQ